MFRVLPSYFNLLSILDLTEFFTPVAVFRRSRRLQLDYLMVITWALYVPDSSLVAVLLPVGHRLGIHRGCGPSELMGGPSEKNEALFWRLLNDGESFPPRATFSSKILYFMICAHVLGLQEFHVQTSHWNAIFGRLGSSLCWFLHVTAQLRSNPIHYGDTKVET